MVSKIEAGINKIMQNLNSAIDAIKAGGDNQNGKIDTLGEKNKVAQLLAGAKQEIGDLIEKNPIDKNMPHNKYLEAEKRIHQLESEARNKIYEKQEALIEPHEIYNQLTGEIENKKGITHKYTDGSYNVKTRELKDGGYVAEHKDKDGNVIGLKAYKNNKEVYTNPDFVAEQLGLKVPLQRKGLLEKSVKYVWDAATFLFSTEQGDQIDKQISELKDNQYYVDKYPSIEVYEWDAKGNQFRKIQ